MGTGTENNVHCCCSIYLISRIRRMGDQPRRMPSFLLCHSPILGIVQRVQDARLKELRQRTGLTAGDYICRRKEQCQEWLCHWRLVGEADFAGDVRG